MIIFKDISLSSHLAKPYRYCKRNELHMKNSMQSSPLQGTSIWVYLLFSLWLHPHSQNYLCKESVKICQMTLRRAQHCIIQYCESTSIVKQNSSTLRYICENAELKCKIGIYNIFNNVEITSKRLNENKLPEYVHPRVTHNAWVEQHTLLVKCKYGINLTQWTKDLF